jgi:hypothetical protein
MKSLSLTLAFVATISLCVPRVAYAEEKTVPLKDCVEIIQGGDKLIQALELKVDRLTGYSESLEQQVEDLEGKNAGLPWYSWVLFGALAGATGVVLLK